MKAILLAYAFIGLLLIALLSLLSYGYGPGYVYLLWRDWQIQSNLWVLFFTLALFSLLLQLCWLALKRYLTRKQRETESVLNFKNLHPYEQLAVIWLLDAGRDQQSFIEQVFAQSGLLKGVMVARLAVMQGQYEQALKSLEQTPAMAFELVEIQRIEIYLTQKNAEQALTHLEFLSQHALSPWLQEIQVAYQQRLTVLWGMFAIQHPWAYLRSTRYGHLEAETKQLWLQQLLQQFDQASIDDLHALQQRYLDLGEQIEQRSYATRMLWLKLLARMPEMAAAHEHLALQLLNEQFNQEVFYLWFQQQLLKQQPDYMRIEAYILQLQTRYPGVPVLTFAEWYIYDATGREEAADQLLDRYPDNVLMSYLRIKSVLKGRDDLIAQLNYIFEKDANFIEIKI